jgi:hypothetical protein
MNTPCDPETSAVEKMLHDRTRSAPPPALRSRVLASVDEVLPKKVPGTKSGKDAQRHYPQYADVVPGTVLIFTLLVVILLSSAATSRPVGPATDRPLLSFAQRAEAAGIELDVSVAPASHVAGHGTREDGARPHDILRSIDTHRFLQGDL